VSVNVPSPMGPLRPWHPAHIIRKTDDGTAIVYSSANNAERTKYLMSSAPLPVGVTEFMVAATGLRPPKAVINYYGKMGRLTSPIDAPAPDCYYCLTVKGLGERADVQHYVREGVGEFLR
jgi:hypothetical protein